MPYSTAVWPDSLRARERAERSGQANRLPHPLPWTPDSAGAPNFAGVPDSADLAGAPDLVGAGWGRRFACPVDLDFPSSPITCLHRELAPAASAGSDRA